MTMTCTVEQQQSQGLRFEACITAGTFQAPGAHAQRAGHTNAQDRLPDEAYRRRLWRQGDTLRLHSGEDSGLETHFHCGHTGHTGLVYAANPGRDARDWLMSVSFVCRQRSAGDVQAAIAVPAYHTRRPVCAGLHPDADILPCLSVCCSQSCTWQC